MPAPLNTIVRGDCLEVLQEIPDTSVDLIITDPPYSTPTVTSFGRQVVKNLADFSIQEFYMKSLRKEFERILKPNGRVFIFCDDKYYPVLFAVFYEWSNLNLLIWDKGRIGMGRPFRKRHELIMYACRSTYDPQLPAHMTHVPTVLEYKPETDREHGAQKPIALVRDLIEAFSLPGETVLDPFVGSGTTAVAAQQLGRNYIGIEMNEEYAAIARRRLEEPANPQPSLLDQAA